MLFGTTFLLNANPCLDDLRPDLAFGIGVQAEEIHPQFGQLREHGLIAVGVPPVGPLGKIVERLDSAPVEQRLPRLVGAGRALEMVMTGRAVGAEVSKTTARCVGFCLVISSSNVFAKP